MADSWGLMAEAEANPDKQWAAKHINEIRANWLNMTWRPYVHFGMDPLQGETITIDAHGRRRTWNANPAAENPYRIFVFGGSTLVGWGARDEFTIPSLLSKKLAADGHNVEVVNYGRWTYINTQETLLLIEQLRKDNVPNLAIFYDGCNEVVGPADDLDTGGPIFSVRMAREHALLTYDRRWDLLTNTIGNFIKWAPLTRLVVRQRPWEPAPDFVASHTDTISRNYASNIRLAENLARSFGFESAFYWQPVAYTKRTLTDNEQRLLDLGGTEKDRRLDFWRQYAETARRKVTGELADVKAFHDISDALNGRTDSVYMDKCHVNEAANELIAERIFADVRSLVRTPAPSTETRHRRHGID
jgi:lysophospholipase L1-like esterase